MVGRILADDFDKDGDTDLVIGNLGRNSQLKGSVKEPITIDYADFNNDDMLDPILCYYNKGKSYPYFSRDELFEQLPALQKRFGRYADYADAQLTDMFDKDQLAKARSVKICETSSMYLKNNNHHFALSPLPQYAQISAVNGIVSNDVDGDGNKDIILAGNFFPFRVQLGPLDAGKGLVLKGDGANRFTPLLYDVTGLNIPGDVRNMIIIHAKDHSLLIAAKNNDAVQVIEINPAIAAH